MTRIQVHVFRNVPLFPFLGELYAQKDLRSAGIAGIGVWIGIAVGTAVRIAISFIMVGVFLFARFV